ncbi:unnamed protein product [Closterium sp. NIES-54]
MWHRNASLSKSTCTFSRPAVNTFGSNTFGGLGAYQSPHHHIASNTRHLQQEGLIKLDVKLRPAHPLLQTAADSQTHINLHFANVERTPAMHGIMGQTYCEGRRKRTLEYTSLSVMLRRSFAADGVEGRGYLDGEVKDYRTSSVMSADCLYTAFDGHTLPPINEANGEIRE